MNKTTLQRRNELMATMFEVLSKTPDGLSFRDALRAIEALVKQTPEEMAQHTSQLNLSCFEEVIWTGTNIAIKAGWLKNVSDHLSLTEAGRHALNESGESIKVYGTAAEDSEPVTSDLLFRDENVNAEYIDFVRAFAVLRNLKHDQEKQGSV